MEGWRDRGTQRQQKLEIVQIASVRPVIWQIYFFNWVFLCFYKLRLRRRCRTACGHAGAGPRSDRVCPRPRHLVMNRITGSSFATSRLLRSCYAACVQGHAGGEPIVFLDPLSTHMMPAPSQPKDHPRVTKGTYTSSLVSREISASSQRVSKAQQEPFQKTDQIAVGSFYL